MKLRTKDCLLKDINELKEAIQLFFDTLNTLEELGYIEMNQPNHHIEPGPAFHRRQVASHAQAPIVGVPSMTLEPFSLVFSPPDN